MISLRKAGSHSEPGKSGFTVAARRALVLLPTLFLFACATTGGGSGGPVVKRAMERWDALLAHDYDTAYEFFSPGYRSSHSRSDFELNMRLRKVQFTNAEFVQQDCTENSCTLNFKVYYTIASPVPGIETWNGNTSIDQKWIMTEGQWWYFPEE